MGVKRSLRCKKCEHNLLKPEFSPNSIKFKIHLCASNQIPDVRILTLPDWNNTEESVSRLSQKNLKKKLPKKFNPKNLIQKIYPKIFLSSVETIKSLMKKALYWLLQILPIQM